MERNIEASDRLAQSAITSAATVEEMAEALRVVSPLLIESGQPKEAEVKMLEELANVGIKGADAGQLLFVILAKSDNGEFTDVS